MALTVPQVDQFYTFWGDEADDVDVPRAQTMLELATNLMWLATNLEDDPTDSRMASLVNFAIMDMAIHLYVTRDDINAEYSPFNSERVGSYSYSKTYRSMMTQVNKGEKTGVPLFDTVVDYYLEQAMGSWVTSERLTHHHFRPLAVEAWLANPSLVFSSERHWDGWPTF